MTNVNVPCSLCDHHACSIRLEQRGDHFSVRIDGFSGPCSHGVDQATFEKLKKSIKEKNWKEIFSLNREFLLGWCRQCEVVYCKDHWDTFPVFDEGFFDYLEGRCPKGHRQMIED